MQSKAILPGSAKATPIFIPPSHPAARGYRGNSVRKLVYMHESQTAGGRGGQEGETDMLQPDVRLAVDSW